jgi:phenylalanyl-tRNA synthetase alpha chain
MKDRLDALLRDGAARIQNAQSEAELQEVKGALLGKQGSITELLKEIPKLDVSLRPEMGKAVNNVKTLLSEQIEGRREELKLKASEISPDFDCTIPGFEPKIGGLHPITQMCYDLNDAFRSMGFEVFGGPEISSE